MSGAGRDRLGARRSLEAGGARYDYYALDAVAEAGLGADDLLRPERRARLAPVVEAVVDGASRHVRRARDLRRGVPSGSFPALLPAVLVDADARDLRRSGYDPFALEGKPGRFRRQLRLVRASFRKRY